MSEALSSRPVGLRKANRRELPPDILGSFAEWVRARRKRNLDTYVAVTGPEGWGKSSLGIQAALAVDPDLEPEEIIMNREDYYRVYDPDKRDQVYVFDEAARLLFNRNWNDRHQRALIQEVIENRQNRNLILLHIPTFKILDKYPRESARISVWFSCTSQGKAMIRRRVWNAFEEKAYYPVEVEEHRWDPLEEAHPEFAEEYYGMKHEAHSSKFHERRREVKEKDRAEAVKEAQKEAKRQRILSQKEGSEE